MDWQPIAYMPAQGFNASLARHQVPRGFVTSSSKNYRRRPLDGAWVRRAGSAVTGDTIPNPAGCTESKWGAKARQIIELTSASLTDSLPTYGVMWTDESDKEGYFYFYNTNNSGHTGLGRVFSATHYPSTTSRLMSAYHHKWVNLWCENGTQQLTRGVSATARKYVGAGTRRLVSVGENLLLPSLQGTPLQWFERRFCDATTTQTEPERVRPWGRVPPLWCPYFKLADLAGQTAAAPWKEGEAFYVSVMFQYEDGSYSMPFIPRQNITGPGASTTYSSNQFGYVQLPTTGFTGASGSTDYFPSITWNGIPIGPADVKARILLRSPKADTVAGGVASAAEMLVCGVIPNNTSTTYIDYNGDDSALLPIEATPYVHYRYAWPMRARYAWEFDGRVAVGYLKQNPAAIILCPTGVSGGTAYRSINKPDTAGTDSGIHLFRTYNNAGTRTLQLRYLSASGAAASTTAITLNDKTLQAVVDEINATFGATTNGGEWAAQLAPGADGQALAWDTTNSVGLAMTDTIDHGDDGVVIDASTGNVRAWSNAWPGVLYFDHTFMAAQQTFKTRFMHTEASPELKQTSVYGNAFSFAVGPAWDIRPPEDAGILMGGRQLQDGCVVFFSKGVYLYRNIRGGRTGQDLDYRLDKISSKGCIAWDSIAGGNDWVGWLSEEGYMVTDGRQGNEHCLSYAIYNPSDGTGVLSYEITECRKAVAKDSDDADFHAKVIGDRLHITYRTAASVYWMLEYDFSETAGSSGLGQILGPGGTPFGWSTRLTYNFGTIGAIRKGDRLMRLGVYQEASTSYTTGDGRLDEWGTGTTDNGTAITAELYFPTDDFGDSRRRKRMRRFSLRYLEGTAGTTLYLYRNRARSASTTYGPLTASAVGLPFATASKRVKLAGQTPSEVYELLVSNDGAGTGHEVHDLTAEVRILETR